MIPTIQYNNETYPEFQSQGFAAKFAFPFAMQVCKGLGVDIGCNRQDWCLPGAWPVDPVIVWDAYDFPYGDAGELDYIFSSHCLEHLPDWVKAIDYWQTKLRTGGVLFLYLPHPSQQYWKPWHNRKHLHVLHPEDIRAYLIDRGWDKVFVSGCDLNNSYMAMAEKK